MADFIHKNIAGEVLLMPLRGITIADGTDTLTFLQLESESSYKITPILRVNDRGKSIAVAYNLEATVYLLWNNFKDNINARLDRFLNKPVTVILPLGTMSSWPFKPSSLTDHNTAAHIKPINVSSINSADQHFINSGPDAYINIEVESVELRPRLIIKIEATVKNFALNRALSDETTTTGNLKIISNTIAV